MQMAMLTNLTKTMTIMPLLPPNAPPKQPPNQPAVQQPPSQPAPQQPPPQQPVPNWPQSLPHQPTPQKITSKWSIGAISNLNSWANLRKMLKHIFCTLMTSMQAHNFEGNVKVDRFCFTMLEEARL